MAMRTETYKNGPTKTMAFEPQDLPMHIKFAGHVAVTLIGFFITVGVVLVKSGWLAVPAKEPELAALTQTVAELKKTADDNFRTLNAKLDGLVKASTPAPAVASPPARPRPHVVKRANFLGL